MKKLLGWCLKIVLGLAVLLALFHLEENWRGKRDWERWKAAQEARGVRFDWSQLAPPEVPDAENFAKAPIVEAVVKRDGTLFPGFSVPREGPVMSGWQRGLNEDLDAWREALEGHDLTRSLDAWTPALDALVQASGRPDCNWHLRHSWEDATGEAVPNALAFRWALRALSLRAVVRIRAADGHLALRDTVAGLRVARHLQSNHFIVNHLVSETCFVIAMQPVWEGLQAKCWSEPELAVLQAELARMDLIESFKRDLEGDLVLDQYVLSSTMSRSSWSRARECVLYLENFQDPSRLKTLGGWILLPSRGWIYQNYLTRDRFVSESWLPALDAEHQWVHHMDPSQLKMLEPGRETLFNHIARFSLPALLTENSRVARYQVSVNEALTACALERYRLAHKAYPPSLDAFVPAYLAKVPCDTVNGQPLRYHTNPDGTFTLYSVGWDGKDDGGQVAFTKDKPAAVDYDHGDWPWPSPHK